jgi:hypothetical protein
MAHQWAMVGGCTFIVMSHTHLGTWSGYLAGIASGVVDTVAAEFTPTTVRMESFLFSAPYLVESMAAASPIVINKATSSISPAETFFQSCALLFYAFNVDVWILLIITLVIAYLCLEFIDNITLDTATKRKPQYLLKHRYVIRTNRTVAAILLTTFIALANVVLLQLYQVDSDNCALYLYV